jgi:hypothetical protein
MQYINRTLVSTNAILALMLISQVGLGETHLGWALAHAPELSLPNPVSEGQVRKILEKKMVGFSADFGPESIPKLAQDLVKVCKMYRFDPAFVLSVIQVESGFAIGASSEMGASGLMQLMPSTAHWIAGNMGDAATQGLSGPAVLTKPFYNIRLGVAYMAMLRTHYEGLSPYFLLAAYNLGPAKLDELRAKPSFKPRATRKYYEAILQGAERIRGFSGFRYVPLPTGA